ncbi:hypothetical protein PHYPSEUDO_003264 [Phytophthora pseudosyringae]|uniref:Transmembrane protein n=1 Tax=Phytophthora pseudosyringae TaxID=221518 RepID=A0A8T1VWB1_9STRA|nr:hypothetical protein PHYPSEUDO_003264 [Phytophthora pseudosyringae]
MADPTTSSTKRSRAREWQQLLLRPDIAHCLAFSKLRCLISIFSIVLLATDIPRSGLGVRGLGQFYPAPIMPDTAVRFGPFDYPVRHIWRTREAQSNESDAFRGLEGAHPVHSANVWSYKYDTTSLGLRGAVGLLNVTGYPDFLLYRGELGRQGNHRAVLALNTTFSMLDAFIAAAQARTLPKRNGAGVSWTSVRFATEHNWVDRAHQYLTHFIWQRRIWSLHSLHVPQIPRPTDSLRICTTATEPNSPPQPRFCTYPGIWDCEHPLNASLPVVRLPGHMDIRFQDLQRRYPDLLLDVTLISTHRPSMSSGTLSYTLFNCEEHEIVMLTRGRRCSGNITGFSSEAGGCRTVFVDDYRYERNTLQTNVEDWYFVIASMRAGAQGYVWVRLALLYYAAFITTAGYPKQERHLYSRLASAVLLVFKIPFQVIVYSSLLPVIGYVASLLLDGNFMDIFLDSYWTTLEGTSNFELLSFFKSAVTQMRTVWLIALLVDLMVLAARKPLNGSEEKLPGIRGLAISFASALTIVGPYKQSTFRNSEIVRAIRLPNVGHRMDTVQATPQWYFNESTYMFDDSMTMLAFCIGVLVAVASAARLVSFCLRADQGLVLISTLNVPYGTEFLWPMTSLTIGFNALPNRVKMTPEPQALLASSAPSSYFSNSKVSPSPPTTFAGPSEPESPLRNFRLRLAGLCSRTRDSATATKAQPPPAALCSRTAASHSVLQLMNITMMTDPWNFFWLRVIGIQLCVYRVRPTRSPVCDVDNSCVLLSYAVILPYPAEELEERTGLSGDDFEFLDSTMRATAEFSPERLVSHPMAAIHPRGASTWDGNAERPTQVPEVTSIRNNSARRASTCEWHNLLPRPDIHHCIALSKLRCIFTVVSLALLLTDIPRTGLGIRNLHEFYPIPLMPSTAVRFGPFEYPVAHIRRLDNDTSGAGGAGHTSTQFAGLKGTQPIFAARAWPYQFDTLSVGLRGAVELLNVTEFPQFLLYKPQEGQPTTNGESFFELRTAFTMLDAFIHAAHAKLRPADSSRPTTMSYVTKHNWVDRIHHFVVRFASTNPAWRWHSLHVPHLSNETRSLALCSNAAIAKRSSPRPRFCNHPGVWKCENPLDPALPPVRLWDHMDLRLQSLQQRYPGLELEMALLTSQRLSSTSGAMDTTFYSYEALEITVLTRGKRCVEDKTKSSSEDKVVTTCTTVFLDDYRYERDTIRTNLVDWYSIISLLRGGAQAYVWLRLSLLIYGAYTATRVKSASSSRLLATASILLKIPFEVVVYSSLLPVSAYVVAQVMDSSFMDIYLDSYWAAVGGSIRIDLVTFLRSTAVQMRNVWLLALLVTLAVLAVRKTREYWGEGIPAIRGLVISFTSTLTVFGPYKETTQRDTNILNLFQVAGAGKTMDVVRSNLVGHFNVSRYLFDDSAVMLLFCVCVVIGMAIAIRVGCFLVSRMTKVHCTTGNIILSSTPVIPCGMQRLWLTSVLSVQFSVRSRVPVKPRSRPSQVVASLLPQPTKVRPIRSPSSISSFKRTTRGNLLGDEDYNSTEFRSILQLMNIAMMTDPWNFVWLRVLGVQLYLYRIRIAPSALGDSSRALSYPVILPYTEDEMEAHTGLSSSDFQLLDSASSRDIPMLVLLQSG